MIANIADKDDVLTAIADVYYHQGKLEAAKEKCEKSLAISNQYGGKIQAGVTLHLLGKILFAQGHAEEARAYVQEAVNIFRTAGSFHFTAAEKTLAEMENAA